MTPLSIAAMLMGIIFIIIIGLTPWAVTNTESMSVKNLAKALKDMMMTTETSENNTNDTITICLKYCFAPSASPFPSLLLISVALDFPKFQGEDVTSTVFALIDVSMSDREDVVIGFILGRLLVEVQPPLGRGPRHTRHATGGVWV